MNKSLYIYVDQIFAQNFTRGEKKLKNLVIRKYKLYEDTKD